MTVVGRTLLGNLRWEATRLGRSRRVWLLLIPVDAGPVGSAVADLYLRVPSTATAEILGLFITAGLSALVTLDLTALAVGEDLAARTQYLTFPLPQGRETSLAGRLLLVVGGSLAGFLVGAGAVFGLAGALVVAQPNPAPPLLLPLHLALGLVGFLVGIAGVTAVAACVTRGAAQALVAGVLAAVVVAGVASFLLLEHELMPLFPLGVGLMGIGGIAGSLVLYGRLEG